MFQSMAEALTGKKANIYLRCPSCGHDGETSEFESQDQIGDDGSGLLYECPKCDYHFSLKEGDPVESNSRVPTSRFTAGTNYGTKVRAYKEAFDGAAPPFGSPEREEWESGKKKEPTQTLGEEGIRYETDKPGKPEDYKSKTKEAAVDFTQKPDGTINIAVEGLPDVPVQPADMGAMEAPVAGGNTATPVTTPAATKGKSSSLVGKKVVDPLLGNGRITAVLDNRVIAAFADGQYETTTDQIS